MKPCKCLSDWRRDLKLARIPPRYRKQTLESINPLEAAHPKQRDLIPVLRERPGASFLLFGRNGSGKSLLGWALYRHAVGEGRPVAACSVADLLMQYRTFEFDREQVPVVNAETLRCSEDRYFVFLDEFEKSRPTEFAAESLFRLLDAVYCNHHQLVITTNLTPKQLQEHWAGASEYYGGSIMRRLFELQDSISVEMF